MEKGSVSLYKELIATIKTLLLTASVLTLLKV